MAWQDFISQRSELADDELAGFMLDRRQPPAQQRDSFEDEAE